MAKTNIRTNTKTVTMRMFFTRKFIFSLLAVLGLIASTDMTAQAVFTIDAPASIAGETPAVIGLFGQNDGGTVVSGEIVIAEDGDANFDADGNAGSTADACQPVSNDVMGRIVLTDRTFVCNAFQASLNLAGATALLVCPNSADPAYETQVAPRGNSTTSDMPVFSLSLERCNEIKMAIGNGDTVSGTYDIDCMPDAPANAVWGTTFANGAVDWSFAGNGWVYDADGYMGAGAISGGLTDADGNRTGNFGYALTSSACDGALVFDSDFLDNGGNRDAATGDILFGTGDCPCVGFEGFFLPEAQRCSGVVTSPSIDISGVAGGDLEIQFQQQVRDFLGRYFVEYSYDGGTVWDTTEINTEIEQAGPIVIETQRVSLCDAAGQDELLIRFRHTAGYYFWVIDDVYVVQVANIDVQANNNFVASAPNFRTPETQLDQHPFLVDVENFGNFGADDVSVTAEVLDAGGNVLFTATQDYGTIESCFLDENRAFADVFDMSGLSPGTYTTRYTVNSPNNTITPVEQRSRIWQVTPSTNEVFSKTLSEAELGEDLGNFGGPTLTAISYGNYYYVVNDAFPVSVRAGLAFQGGDNDVTEFIADVNIQVFTFFDDNGDGAVQPEERELIAEEFIEVESASPDLGDFGVTFERDDVEMIEGGSNVLVMAHVQSLDPLDYAIRFKAAGTDDFRDFDYSAMALASDTLGFPRFGSFIATGGGDVSERVFTWTNAQNLAAYMPLTIETVGPNSNEEVNDAVVSSIFPNPASEFVNVELNLEQASEDVQISLIDVAGKVASVQNFSNIKSETVTINIDGLSAGSYVVKIRTDEGVTSRKVIILD